MLRTLVKTTGSFLLSFWENEVSQMSKVDVLSVASVLAVLAVAAMPQPAAAAQPCDTCPADPNCDYSQCNPYCACAYEPCQLYRAPCAGGNWKYAKTCVGNSHFCGSCTCS